MSKPTKRQPKEKPVSEMTEAERIDHWRRKRFARGPIARPNLKGSRKEEK